LGNVAIPIEVMDGTASTPNPSATMTCAHPVSTSFTLDSTALGQATQLYLKTHGLNYSTQGSFQINSSPWVRMKNVTTGVTINQDNPNITVLGSANRYGGIGGAFTIIRFTLPLSTPTSGSQATLGAYLQSGANSINFCFNGTDSRSVGYRVVDLNLYNSASAPVTLASGSQAITTYEDNTDWTTVPSDGNPTNGAKIWTTTTLVESSVSTNTTILAHCSDCHTDSGSDLRYFNYSNFSIRQRAIFHGITNEQDLDDLAAYIRSLNVADTTQVSDPGPGRPWWPVFQPGPGLDSKPGSYWAAGAGDTAVLDDAITDPETGKVQAINARQTPIAYQLLDWNHWLTPLHPADALGSVATFQAEAAYTDLQTILTRLSQLSSNASSLAAYLQGGYVYNPVTNQYGNWSLGSGDVMQFYTDRSTLESDVVTAVQAKSGATAADIASYDAALWSGVKFWQYHQQYGLESLFRNVIGNRSEKYEWFDSNRFVFDISPHITSCCNVNDQYVPMIGDIAQQNVWLAANPTDPRVRLNATYLNDVWYETQAIVHHGTNDIGGGGHLVIDWGYMRNEMSLAFEGLGNYMEPLRAMKSALLGLYEHDTGVGPSTSSSLYAFNSGFDPFQHNASFSNMLNYGEALGLTNNYTSNPQYNSLVETYYEVWLKKLGNFNLEDWITWNQPSFADDGINVLPFSSTISDLQNVTAPFFLGEINTLTNQYFPCSGASCKGPGMATALVNAYARWVSEMYPGPSGTPNNWSSYFMPTSNLSAPTVTATPGIGSATVQWTAVPGATSYNVKRATAAGQPGLTVAFFVSGTSYFDPMLTGGKTYYYQVSANEDPSGSTAHFGSVEGPDSEAVETVPNTGLVASWNFDSINSSPSTPVPNLVTDRPMLGTASSGAYSPNYMSVNENLAFWVLQNVTVTAQMVLNPTALASIVQQTAVVGSNPDMITFGMPQPSGKIAVLFDNGCGSNGVTTTTAINDGKSHFVAMSHNVTTGVIEISIDGAAPISGTGCTGYLPGAKMFSVGRADGTAQPFPGQITNVSIYNTDYQGAALQALYQ
jgi:hypothetical protein